MSGVFNSILVPRPLAPLSRPGLAKGVVLDWLDSWTKGFKNLTLVPFPEVSLVHINKYHSITASTEHQEH